MRKLITLLIPVIFLLGCATAKTDKAAGPILDQSTVIQKVEKKKEPVVDQPDSSPQLQNIDEEKLEEYTLKKGVVFAKTEFQGVLLTSYVKLLIEDSTTPSQKYQLHIGDKANVQTFPWEVKSVEPGYFYIELPVGRYRISSISIPVGTSMATEDSSIYFDVLEDTIVYIGTIKMVGTKEKIKLGGVPVIQPGFEYTVEILDESEQAQKEFEFRYPNVRNEITTQLMTLESG